MHTAFKQLSLKKSTNSLLLKFYMQDAYASFWEIPQLVVLHLRGLCLVDVRCIIIMMNVLHSLELPSLTKIRCQF